MSSFNSTAAGVGKTTVYRRYRNKGELVIAALETFVQRPRVPDSGSTRDDLETVLHHFDTHVMSGLGISTIGTLMVEEERHPEFIARVREHMMEPRRDVFRTILRRGVDRGDLRPDLDVDMCIDFLTGGLVMRRFVGGKSRRSYAQRALEALWPGIVADSGVRD